MKMTRLSAGIIFILIGILLFSQQPLKKSVWDFINYLNTNKETLQYKSFETIQKGDKVEIRVFCQEATQNKLIEAIRGFATEKHYFEKTDSGDIVFTAIFPSATLQAPPSPAKTKKAVGESAVPAATDCKGKIKVTTQPIKPEAFDEYASYPARLENQNLGLKASAGLVSEVMVKPGSAVKANQVLAVIQAIAKEEVAKQEAEVAKAKKIYNSRKNWKVPDEKAIKQAEDNYQKAQDLLEQKKAQMALPLVSPCNGIIKAVSVTSGTTVAEGSVAVEMENTDLLEGTFTASPEDLSLFSRKESIPAIVARTGESVNVQITGIQEKNVQVAADNAYGKYSSGMEILVRKMRKHHDQAIAIPAECVQKNEIGHFAYVVDKNKAKQIYVTAGPTEKGKTLIIQGLTPDFTLITSGFTCLQEGKKIRILTPEQVKKEEKKEMKVEKVPRREEVVTPVEVSEGLKGRFLVGLDFGRFAVNDKNLKNFYGHGWLNIPGFELSFHLKYNIDLWASYKIYMLKAKTSFFENEVKFRINPIFVGLRYRPTFQNPGRFEPFAGAGLNFYSYSESIYGESDLTNTKGSAVGFHFQVGTYVQIIKMLKGQVFMRLNMVKKTLEEALPDGADKLNLGGLEFGIGFHVKL